MTKQTDITSILTSKTLLSIANKQEDFGIKLSYYSIIAQGIFKGHCRNRS